MVNVDVLCLLLHLDTALLLSTLPSLLLLLCLLTSLLCMFAVSSSVDCCTRIFVDTAAATGCFQPLVPSGQLCSAASRAQQRLSG